MRDIKFRAWDTGKNQWKGIWIFRGGHVGQKDTYEVPEIFDLSEWAVGRSHQGEVIVMQYTGLQDKNGKEIFEGDIVKAKTWYGINRYIRYARASFFVVKSRRSCHTRNILNPAMIHKKHIEVIGNIYENPELLEAK